jgi:general secretion pathway protein A
MYLDFFGFKKGPFNVTPDPEFLFAGPSHKEALASIVHGVMSRKGFIVITGEVGVGKTTILRYFLDRYAKGQLHTIYLFNANVSFTALLKIICHHLGLPVNTGDTDEMLRNLNRFLISEFREGGNVALIIDEAQNMPVETLENLRMLSNLETATDKLIQIIFSGQPEFEKTLDRHELRQLKQRIAVRATILPLSGKESAAYIRHRVTRALKRDARIFTPGAVGLIIKHAQGIPRVINIICDNALVAAFVGRKKEVNKSVVREIIRIFSENEQRPVPYLRRPATALTFVASAAIAVAMLAISLGSWRHTLHNPDRVVLPIVREAVKPAGLPAVPSSPHGKISEDARVIEGKGPLPALKPAGSMTTAGAATEGRDPASAGNVSEVKKVVKTGDRLERLMADVYGTSNGRLMNMVKLRNPALRDCNVIVAGETIVFPLGESR